VNYTTSEDSLTRGLDRISADRTSSSSNLNESDGTKDHVVTAEQPVDFSVALGTLSDLLNLKSSMRILEDEKCSSSSKRFFSSPDYLTRCILIYGRSREVRTAMKPNITVSPVCAIESSIHCKLF
jgi:hypothetical protein